MILVSVAAADKKNGHIVALESNGLGRRKLNNGQGWRDRT